VECLRDVDEDVRWAAEDALRWIFREFAESVENELARLRASEIDLSEMERMLAELKASIEQNNLSGAWKIVKKLEAELNRIKGEDKARKQS